MIIIIYLFIISIIKILHLKFLKNVTNLPIKKHDYLKTIIRIYIILTLIINT